VGRCLFFFSFFFHSSFGWGHGRWLAGCFRGNDWAGIFNYVEYPYGGLVMFMSPNLFFSIIFPAESPTNVQSVNQFRSFADVYSVVIERNNIITITRKISSSERVPT